MISPLSFFTPFTFATWSKSSITWSATSLGSCQRPGIEGCRKQRSFWTQNEPGWPEKTTSLTKSPRNYPHRGWSSSAANSSGPSDGPNLSLRKLTTVEVLKPWKRREWNKCSGVLPEYFHTSGSRTNTWENLQQTFFIYVSATSSGTVPPWLHQSAEGNVLDHVLRVHPRSREVSPARSSDFFFAKAAKKSKEKLSIFIGSYWFFLFLCAVSICFCGLLLFVVIICLYLLTSLTMEPTGCHCLILGHLVISHPNMVVKKELNPCTNLREHRRNKSEEHQTKPFKGKQHTHDFTYYLILAQCQRCQRSHSYFPRR